MSGPPPDEMFDDQLFPHLVDAVKARLLVVEPTREWYCRVRPGDATATPAGISGGGPLREYEVFTWCMVDGGTYGFTFALPEAAALHDLDHGWVESIAHQTTVKMLYLVARLN